MGRFIHDANANGSLGDIQILVNKKPEVLNRILVQKMGKPINIVWKSPLETDQYAEYRDQDFLGILGISDKIKQPLLDFWPNKGPQWDALGIDNEMVFLVEAKANIPEIVSPGTGAGSVSKAKIMDAFDEVKEYLGISNEIDWSSTFYQYVNRIAYLYYLRVLNGIDAYLVNIYFYNDNTVESPKTVDEWNGAIKVVKKYLGLAKNYKLQKYVYEVFIDAMAEGIRT